jgi:hypothetical protein
MPYRFLRFEGYVRVSEVLEKKVEVACGHVVTALASLALARRRVHPPTAHTPIPPKPKFNFNINLLIINIILYFVKF